MVIIVIELIIEWNNFIEQIIIKQNFVPFIQIIFHNVIMENFALSHILKQILL
jgi:hypothetical protein